MDYLTRQMLKKALAVAVRQHGGILNQAQFARLLHLSMASVRGLLRAMLALGWTRLLPAYCPPGNRGCFRRPRINVVSAPLLALGLGPGHRERVDAASIVEGIIRAELRTSGTSNVFSFGTYDMRSLDLIVERDGVRMGYLIMESEFPRRRETSPLRRAVASGAVSKAYLLHSGVRGFFCGRGVIAVPAPVFLARYEDFTAPQDRYEGWHLMLRWLNRAGVGPSPEEEESRAHQAHQGDRGA